MELAGLEKYARRSVGFARRHPAATGDAAAGYNFYKTFVRGGNTESRKEGELVKGTAAAVKEGRSERTSNAPRMLVYINDSARERQRAPVSRRLRTRPSWLLLRVPPFRSTRAGESAKRKPKGRTSGPHLILEYVGGEGDALAMDVGFDEGEGAANPVEGDVGETEVGGHVDEVRTVRHEFSVPCAGPRN